MNLNDVKLIIDVLNVRADELKLRVESHSKLSSKLVHLSDVVRNSTLDANYVSDLIFLLSEKDTDIWMEIFEMNSKISAIDSFVGHISDSLEDNDDTCFCFFLDCDSDS